MESAEKNGNDFLSNILIFLSRHQAFAVITSLAIQPPSMHQWLWIPLPLVEKIRLQHFVLQFYKDQDVSMDVIPTDNVEIEGKWEK